MKKLIPIFCLFVFTSFHPAGYSTTWGGNQIHQPLSKTAFLDGYNVTFLGSYSTGGHTFSSSSELITKAEVLAGTTWTGLNTSDPQWVATASNEVVTKADFSIVMTISTTSGSAGCAQTGSQTVYYDPTTQYFYTNASMTTAFVGSGNFYTNTFLGMDFQINSSGQLTSTFAC